MKTHQGIKKRFKKTNPKNGNYTLLHQSKGRGSKHLKSKQSNPRKHRIRKARETIKTKNLKRTVRHL